MAQNDDEEPLTEQELHVLREMLRDFDRAKWFRGQIKWWALWILGIPTALVGLIQAFDALNGFLSKMFK